MKFSDIASRITGFSVPILQHIRPVLTAGRLIERSVRVPGESMFARRRVAVLTFLLVGFAPAAWALTASSPDDICAPTDDPCVVSTHVVLEPAPDFDFGLRTLRIAPRGKLDSGEASRQITCGGLIIDEGGTLRMRGRPSFYGGSVQMFVNGHCADNPGTACTADNSCPGSTCTGGNVVISGLVDGRARVNSTLDLSATGTITLDGRIDFRGRPAVAPTSKVHLNARQAILASGEILARRRGSDLLNGSTSGGEVTLSAGGDVSLANVVIDVRGGDAGAGIVEVAAGGNVSASGDFRMNATGGGGYGGILRLDADGNAVIDGKTDGKPTLFNLRGHSSKFRGSGGLFAIGAGGDATLSDQVQVRANGDNSPGGYIEVTAGNAVTIGGSLSSAPTGTAGAGGILYVDADGPVTIPVSAVIDVGPSLASFDGEATIYAGGPVQIDGEIRASGNLDSGSIMINGNDNVTVTGKLLAHGTDAPSYRVPIFIEGCDVSIASAALLSATAEIKGVHLAARESMLIESGASVLASGPGSSIEIAYRDPSNPPSVLGTLAPAPTIFVDDTLAACP